MIRTAAHWLSPGGPRARLSILIFHRVVPEHDPLQPDEPDPRRFEEVLRWMQQWFNVLPLDEAVARLAAGTLPARAAAISFDDGYADNALVALPVLKKVGLPATFFVATSFLDGGRMWNDTVIESVRRCRGPWLDLESIGLGRVATDGVEARRRAIGRLLPAIKYLGPGRRAEAVAAVQRACGEPLPDDLMMTSALVLALRRAGMQVGAHTRTHPILANIDDATAAAEIEGSKRDLEALLGEPVPLFAYPNGKPVADYDARHVQMVRRAGFVAAVSTSPGTATARSDPFQLPRFLPWDRQPLRFGMRMISNLRREPALAWPEPMQGSRP